MMHEMQPTKFEELLMNRKESGVVQGKIEEIWRTENGMKLEISDVTVKFVDRNQEETLKYNLVIYDNSNQEYKLGNINVMSLYDIVNSNKMVEFGIDKRNALPDKCLRCKYFSLCHGECPKHRFDTTERGEYGLNSLCDGLMYFFSHVEPYMIKMRDLIFENKAPKDIMKMKL